MAAEISDYAKRLALAMGFAEDERPSNEAITALAKALDISYQAVEKYFRGESNALQAKNNALAAAYLKVDPDWLSTGEGEMRSVKVWPFGDQITPLQFATLSAEEVQPAIDVLLGAIRRKSSPSNGGSGKPDQHAA